MKCDLCKQNEATVSVNHMAGESVSKLNLCEQCASQKGLNLQMAVPLLTDLILGMGNQKERRGEGGEKVCSRCQMKLSEFRKTSLLGCPACYEAFRCEVAEYLGSMQKGEAHIGKTPASHQMSAEIQSLQRSLQEAVRSQDFEEAARLRDQMQALKNRRGKRTAVRSEPAAGLQNLLPARSGTADEGDVQGK